MNPSTSAEMMAHPTEPTLDTSGNKPPMAHPKGSENFGRRIMGWVREHPRVRNVLLAAPIALGGAGTVHHTTGIDVTGPVGLGAAADSLGSAAVDSIVKSSYSVPQQEQENIDQERATIQELFKPNGFQANGQIEFSLANLLQARTQEMLLAARLGNHYEGIDPSKITAIGNSPAEQDSRFTVDNPTTYGQGLEKSFRVTVKTDKGDLTVLIPESSVTIIKPGELKPLRDITDTTPLDVVRKISPTQ